MTGAELYLRIRAYRQHVHCTLAMLAEAADVDAEALYALKWRGWMPEPGPERLLDLIARYPDGFAPRVARAFAVRPAEGLAGVIEAQRLSIRPARPCPLAVARAAEEDRWSRAQRARRAA